MPTSKKSSFLASQEIPQDDDVIQEMDQAAAADVIPSTQVAAMGSYSLEDAMHAEAGGFFGDGPFKLPVINHDVHGGVYALGVYYPDKKSSFRAEGYFSSRKASDNGYINNLVDVFNAKNNYFSSAPIIGLLSRFFCLHLRTDLNLVLTCTPSLAGNTLRSPLHSLVSSLCRWSTSHVNGADLFRCTNAIGMDEDDLDLLDASITLNAEELAGKTVVLFSDFCDISKEANSVLSVCQAKLRHAGATLYTICLANIYNPDYPNSDTCSRYLNYAYGLAIDHFGEAIDSIADGWKDGCSCSDISVLGIEIPLDCAYFLSLDEVSGAFRPYSRDPMKEVIEQANYEASEALEELEDISYYQESGARLRKPTAMSLLVNCSFPNAREYTSYLGKFIERHRRLFLGEHDFTLSAALITKYVERNPIFPYTCVATEFQSLGDIIQLQKAREKLLIARLKGMEKSGAQIRFGIDARNLTMYEEIPKRVPKIYFYFPHDGSDYQKRSLPKLLRDFFMSATDIQSKSDRVFMTLAQPQGSMLCFVALQDKLDVATATTEARKIAQARPNIILIFKCFTGLKNRVDDYYVFNRKDQRLERLKSSVYREFTQLSAHATELPMDDLSKDAFWEVRNKLGFSSAELKAELKGGKKFYQGYYYGIFEASARAGYVLVDKYIFDSDEVPGYKHAETKHDCSADVAEEARKFVFMKTSLTYEQIVADKKYGPSGKKRFYGEDCYLLPDLETKCETNSQSSPDSIVSLTKFFAQKDSQSTSITPTVAVAPISPDDEVSSEDDLPPTPPLTKYRAVEVQQTSGSTVLDASQPSSVVAAAPASVSLPSSPTLLASALFDPRLFAARQARFVGSDFATASGSHESKQQTVPQPL